MAGVREANRPEELTELKEKYGEQCKIIDDIGEFKHVVTMRRNTSDLAYKFQLGGNYPQTAPNIVIKSSQLSDYDKAELAGYLQNACAAGSTLKLDALVQLADDWLKTQNLNYVFVEAEESDKKSAKKGKKKQKQRKPREEEVYQEKKCSMKTADDVIKRIQWDSELQSEDFIVAYIDRFIGVVENHFSAFSWEDLASVDYDELAIPKHRIQYFKYKKEVVWDKKKRLDNFFGSTGSNITILDVIRNYQEPTAATESMKRSPLLGDTDSEDSDSDDEVVIDTGFSDTTLPSKPTVKQRELREELTEEKAEEPMKEQTEETTEEQAEQGFQGVRGRDLYWGEKRRPTHFICLRITDQSIREMVKNIQTTVQILEPDFAGSFLPVDRLHITLACVGLDTVEDVNRATKALHDIHASLQETDPQKIDIELNGTDNFFHNVLYAKVTPNEKFMDFVELLKSLLIASDIEIRDVFDYHPHMTLLKFKKGVIKGKKTRTVLDSRIYSAVGDPYFGKQTVSNIHLCVMSEQCDESGFYIRPANFSFTDRCEKK